MILSILLAIFSLFQPAPQPKFVQVKVENQTSINLIGERPVTFGVKENMEELLANEGYSPNDTMGVVSRVTIDSIQSPQQILNIVGTKWLRKDYLVTVTVCMDGECKTETGKRKTFIFAAFLEVENNEIPLNRKAFSKALLEGLRKASSI